MKKTFTGIILLCLMLIPMHQHLQAQCMTGTGGYSVTTGPNGCDDCGSAAINLGFTYDICGSAFTQVFINSNGNVTFGSNYTTYTPVGMPNASTRVMVAPFWSDVDLRDCGTIYNRAYGAPAFGVIWDQVGYYFRSCDKLNTYQLILTDGTVGAIGVGNNTAFYYGDMQWTTGDASGGTSGFGGSEAIAGVNANDGVTAYVYGGFDNSGSAYSGLGSSGNGVNHLDNLCLEFATGTASCILPVDFIKVEAEVLNQRSIRIDWLTNNLTPQTGFAIERSTDGTSYTQIGYQDNLLSAPSTESSQYSLEDKDTDRNVLYYYRVKQIAMNGRTQYSPVVTAMITDIPNVVVGKPFPNPAVRGSAVSLPITSSTETKGEFRVYDQLGKLISRKDFSLGLGENNIALTNGDLAPGIYMGELIINGYHSTPSKFVIH